MDTVSIVTRKDGTRQLIYEPRIQRGEGIWELHAKEEETIEHIESTNLLIEDVMRWSKEKVYEYLYKK